jgi:hypothetical protein
MAANTAALQFEEISRTDIVNPPTAYIPVVTYIIATLNDLVGFASLALVSLPLNFLFAMYIFIWLLGKASFVQKRLLRFFIRRAWILAFGAIPLLGAFIPESIILVYLIHNKEKEAVKTFFKLLGAEDDKRGEFLK